MKFVVIMAFMLLLTLSFLLTISSSQSKKPYFGGPGAGPFGRPGDMLQDPMGYGWIFQDNDICFCNFYGI